ncbi:MAG TPA: hypothetical protein ENO22_12760 [candidate division Zixibacteria bacterium]|nr:hypothetical protein [candidate division Zixibacteria bacterium]
MKGIRILLLISLVLAGTFLMWGCEDKPHEPRNLPPEEPSNPSPVNFKVGITLNSAELSWECSDPEGDSISYDIYLGTSESPPLLESGYSLDIFYPGLLAGDAQYYWQIAASDDQGNPVFSPTWTFFTVGAQEFVYPLGLGYRWEYEQSTIFTNFDPLEIEPLVPRLPDSYSVIEINDYSDVDGERRYQLHEVVEQGPDTFEQNSIYANGPYGLLYYGTDGSVGGIMDTPAPVRNQVRFRFAGREYSSTDELLRDLGLDCPAPLSKTADFYDEPRASLRYSMNVGLHWPYRDRPEDIFHIEKMIVAWDDVYVPAGDFECFIVEWLYDLDFSDNFDEDLQVLDYISAAGLVKRVATIRNIVVVTYANPTGIGTMDMIETLILTDYSIKPQTDQ